MKLHWAILCQRVLTDRDSNTVSYIEAVEQLTLPALPIRFPAFFVGTLWEREESTETLVARVRILDPDGKTILKVESKEHHFGEAARHRLNFLVGGGTIAEEGTYTVRVDQRSGDRWRRVKDLEVIVRAAETGVPGPGG